MFADGFIRFSSSLAKVLAALLPDLLFLGGVGAVIWGVHLWSIPLAYVIGGILVALVGLMAVRSRARRRGNEGS